MTQPEIAALVQAHLLKKGIDVVLSGGASVAVYSENAYVSKDVDLVNPYSVRASAIGTAMREIGFQEEGRYFRHPDSDVLVEFPPGPLAVGAEPVREVQEIELATGTLKLVSPRTASRTD